MQPSGNGLRFPRLPEPRPDSEGSPSTVSPGGLPADPHRIPADACEEEVPLRPEPPYPPSGEEEPPEASARPPVSRALRLRAWVAQSTPAQLLIAAVIFGAGLSVYMVVRPDPPADTHPIAAESPRFPSLPFVPQGAAVTEAEVGTLLERPTPSAPVRDAPAIPRWKQAPNAAPGTQVSPQAVRRAPRSRRPPQAVQTRAIPGATDATTVVRRMDDTAVFYEVGGVLRAGSDAPAAVSSLEVGRRIPVVLREGLSSAYGGVVLAQVTAPVGQGADVLLEPGDVLKGRLSSDGERIFIDFYEAATSHRTVKLAGYATDGKYPGVLAERRKASLQERSRGGAMAGAMEAARGAAAGIAAAAAETLPGQLVGSVAANAAGQALSEVQRGIQAEDGFVLQIAQGRKFHVVVTGG